MRGHGIYFTRVLIIRNRWDFRLFLFREALMGRGEIMKLPHSIAPCPIVETIFEVRFGTSTPADAVFGLVYHALRAEMPKVELLAIGTLPPAMRQADAGMAYQPHHRLTGGPLTALIGPRVVALAWTGDYPGWEKFADFVRNAFKKVEQEGLIDTTERLGLRYISLFPGDVLPKLALDLTLNGRPLVGRGTSVRTLLERSGCQCLLHVGKDMALAGNPQKGGTIIDIDAHLDASSGAPLPEVPSFLETAHFAEKELFFSLLRADFLSTLSPVYDSAV